MGNRVSDALGIQYPLLMGAITDKVRLAAAVSEAGGLGCIDGNVTPEHLRSDIREFRKLSSRPFSANFPLVSTPQKTLQERMQIIADEHVAVVLSSAGSPALWTKFLHDAGVLVAHVVPTVYHARKAVDAGVDVVVGETYESGGYRGETDVTMMVLIPAIRRAFPDIPLVAAGSISDRRGYVAVRALGADGVQVGTRLIATHEAEFPDHYKKLILAAEDTSTISGDPPLRPRISKPEFAERVLGEQKRAQMGQGAALIDSLLSVEEVFHEIFRGGAEYARQLADEIEALDTTTMTANSAN